MSDDVIDESLEQTEAPKRQRVKRRKDGTVAKGSRSLNPKGRPVGSKSKINANKLINFLNTNGIYSLNRLVEIGKTLETKGELVQAARVFMFVAQQAITLMNKQMGMELQEAKALLEKEAGVREDEDDNPVNNVILSFQRNA